MSAFLSPIEPAGQDISPASHVPLPWRSGEPSADTGAKGSHVAADDRTAHCLSMQPLPQSGVLPCTKHSHLAPHSFTNTSPSSAAAVFGRHCSLIHTIPAPQQRLPCLEDTGLLFTQYQPRIIGCCVWKTLVSYSHNTSPASSAAVCKGLRSLTHSRRFGAPASVGRPAMKRFSRSPTHQQ